jgi:hypothetical protein
VVWCGADVGDCQIRVHRLAAYQKFGAAMFAPGIEERHLDGCKTNNRQENIAIGTHQQNAMDQPPEQRRRTARAAAAARRRFSMEQVREIRARRARGEEVTALASEYGASLTSISFIVNNKTYQEAA